VWRQWWLFPLSCCYYVFRRKRIRKEEELKLAQSYIDGLERERTRLAKDLHDGVCNDLLGIGMNMQYMQPTDESKREILALLEQVRSDVRCISHELMPPKFQVTTLAETVEAYVEGLALPASVQLAFSKENEEIQWSQVPEEVSYEVYRIMQELLSNILKHSGATEIDVTLTLKRKLLTLQISNNGKNYCGDEVRGKGIGLTTIQERAKAVGGLFTTDIQDGSQKFRLEISLSI
jgi:two-component system NarL family sensor kinase